MTGYFLTTMRGGRRMSTARAYLHPARRRPNLTVVTGAHATRAVFESRRAVGVVYRQGAVEHEVRAARDRDDAMNALAHTHNHPDHEFWLDDAPFVDSVREVCGVLQGHNQTTDAYLVSLAARRKAKFATFDKGVPSLFATAEEAARVVELLEGSGPAR